MRIDNGVNYSSFMQHFNPLDIRPVDQSQLTPAHKAEEKSAEKIAAAKEVAAVTPVEAQDGKVVSLQQHVAQKAKSSFAVEPLEDIKVDFGTDSAFGEVKFGGFEDGSIRKAISDMEKDSMLHEYQYFIGNRRAETLVDNADGIVTRLGA